MSVASNGSWSNSPLVYGYQWKDCDSGGEKCTAIPGAVNQTYTPQARDAGYTLVVVVTALNADGAGVASTAKSNAIALSAPKYSLKMGSLGEGSGQLKNPAGAAIDGAGNVWIADHNNNRLEEFTASGTFVEAVGWGVSNGESKLKVCTSSCRVGTAGGFSGEFSSPDGIAIGGEDIYVADAGNNRIEEMNTKGEYVGSFGRTGSEPGQLRNPVAVAIAQGGSVWVADRTNNRIDEFSEAGTYIGSFGSAGTGGGQFKEPSGIAFSGEYAYVVDAGNSRVEQFTMSGNYLARFGSAGSGNGQFSAPAEIATEPVSGDLYVADSGNSRIEEFSPAGSFLVKVGGAGEGEGQFKGVEGIAATTSGKLYAADLNNNRVQEFVPTYSTSNPAPAPPSVGFERGEHDRLPGSGLGHGRAIRAELQRSRSVGAAGRSHGSDRDLPARRTDGLARAGLQTGDDHLPRHLRARRQHRLALGRDLDRRIQRNEQPGPLAERIQPCHGAQRRRQIGRSLETARHAEHLQRGRHRAARNARPAPHRQARKRRRKAGTRSRAQLLRRRRAGRRNLRPGDQEHRRAEYEGKETDVRTIVTSYSGQENLGWLLRKPTSVTTDPSGLNLTNTTVYDPTTGNVLEAKLPSDGGRTEWPPPTYASSFGSVGSGNGQLKTPSDLTTDSSGDVWVMDLGNSRVEESSSAGVFVRAFGSSGSGNGQFPLR